MFALALARRNTATQPAFAQVGRRARLLSSSALAGGTLRGLALAAGLAVTVPKLAPTDAAAEFVCGGSATGAEPQTGAGAVATGADAVACGTNATANGANATAVGAASLANGGSASAFGAAANANGNNTTAVGSQANANTGFATAIGSESVANGGAGFATAVGGLSNANGGDPPAARHTAHPNAARAPAATP